MFIFLKHFSTNITFVHFSASTFGTLFASIYCSGADYALFWCYLGQKIDEETTLSNGAIWDKFGEQH